MAESSKSAGAHHGKKTVPPVGRHRFAKKENPGAG